MVVPFPDCIVVIQGSLDFAGLCSKSEDVLPLKAASDVCFLCMRKGLDWNDRNRSRPNVVCGSLVPDLFVSGCLPVVVVEVGVEGPQES